MEWINELLLPGGDIVATDRSQGSIFFVGNATVILKPWWRKWTVGP